MQNSGDDEKRELILPIRALARLSDLEMGGVGSCMVPLNIEICALFKSYLLIGLWDYAPGVVLTSELVQTEGS